MRNSKSKKGNKLAVVLGLIWGILLVVLAVSIKNIFTYRNEKYVQSPEYILNSVISGDYGNIYTRVQKLIEGGFTEEELPEYRELFAIHDYLEAAAGYKIYEKNGLADKASLYQKRMDEASDKLGGLEFTASEIDKALGLTK